MMGIEMRMGMKVEMESRSRQGVRKAAESHLAGTHTGPAFLEVAG